METTEKVMMETLEDAIKNNDKNVIEALIELGASKDKVLEKASELGNVDMVGFALKLGAKPVLTEKALSNYEITEMLLQNGANPNGEAIDAPNGFSSEFEGIRLPLQVVVDCKTESEAIKFAKLLISYGADVNARRPVRHNRNRKSPFTNAIEDNKLKLVEFFIKNGANLDEKYSSLYKALFENKLNMSKLLIRHGCKIKVETYITITTNGIRHIPIIVFKVNEQKLITYQLDSDGTTLTFIFNVHSDLKKSTQDFITKIGFSSLSQEEINALHEFVRQAKLDTERNKAEAERLKAEKEAEDIKKMSESLKEQEMTKNELSQKLSEILSRKQSA